MKFLIVVGCLLSAKLFAQQSLESEYRMTGKGVTDAFENQRLVLQTSSAVIQEGRTELVYGVVISPDGWILTKASEVEGKKLSVTIDQTKYPDAEIVTINPEWDVALIKIPASGLVPVVYAPASAIPQGSWVVTNGASSRVRRRALAGIISANIREIPATGGVGLGIVLKPDAKTLEIDSVTDGSGAKEAGLKPKDVILQIDGQSVKKSEDISKVLKDRKAGSRVKVSLLRDGKKISADILLSPREEMYSDKMKAMNRNDMMSGDFSKRRSGFPRILQHDILGSSHFTGGPLLDLDGKCLGMNIARANRAESFAIPVEDLRELAGKLLAQAKEKRPENENR